MPQKSGPSDASRMDAEASTRASNPSIFEDYVKNLDLRELLEALGAPNMDVILREVEHFTEKEAERRDRILLDYFGECGIRTIVESIVERLTSAPSLKIDAKILDLGAGSGLFTIRVAEAVRRHLPRAAFYAMDVTPAMLSILARKTREITPFIGVAEDIAGSVEYSKRYLELPGRYDAVFSTLMLHHCLDVKRVFRSIRGALEEGGKAVVVDLCEHPFKEFREEMGDIHLGFGPSMIEEAAESYFSNVRVENIPGICCESSGRSAELFIAYLT